MVVKIAVANNKGGPAKTETVKRLGYAFASMGYQVTLLDLDGQANLSDALGADDASPTMSQVLDGKCELVDALRIIELTGGRRLCLVRADDELNDTADDLVSKPLGILRLKQAFERCPDAHLGQIVLMDCPPNLGTLTFSAFIAATHVLIPAMPLAHSIKGVGRVLAKLEEVKQGLGHQPTVLGTLATMVRKNIKHDEGIAMLTAMDLPLLGQIPLCDAQYADGVLNAAYGYIAQLLAMRLALTPAGRVSHE